MYVFRSIHVFFSPVFFFICVFLFFCFFYYVYLWHSLNSIIARCWISFSFIAFYSLLFVVVAIVKWKNGPEIFFSAYMMMMMICFVFSFNIVAYSGAIDCCSQLIHIYFIHFCSRFAIRIYYVNEYNKTTSPPPLVHRWVENNNVKRTLFYSFIFDTWEKVTDRNEWNKKKKQQKTQRNNQHWIA